MPSAKRLTKAGLGLTKPKLDGPGMGSVRKLLDLSVCADTVGYLRPSAHGEAPLAKTPG